MLRRTFAEEGQQEQVPEILSGGEIGVHLFEIVRRAHHQIDVLDLLVGRVRPEFRGERAGKRCPGGSGPAARHAARARQPVVADRDSLALPAGTENPQTVVARLILSRVMAILLPRLGWDIADGSSHATTEQPNLREPLVSLPNAIEVVTLFVDDIGEAKAFYAKVFEPCVLFEDDVSCVLKFDGAMVNLLQASQAPQLIQPSLVAPAASGARMLLTIRVGGR